MKNMCKNIVCELVTEMFLKIIRYKVFNSVIRQIEGKLSFLQNRNARTASKEFKVNGNIMLNSFQ